MARDKGMAALQGVDENERFRKGNWLAERLAWGLYAAIILAALAGLAGDGGYFSSRTVITAAAEIDMPLTGRRQAETELRIRFREGAASRVVVIGAGGSPDIAVSGTAPPSTARAQGETVVLDFGGGPAAGAVRIGLTPQRAGMFRLRVQAGGGAAAEAPLFILP